MTYYDYVRTAPLPKIIDEYVIMTTHAAKLRVHLKKMEYFGCPDYDNQYYYTKMCDIIKTYKEFLSKGKS